MCFPSISGQHRRSFKFLTGIWFRLLSPCVCICVHEHMCLHVCGKQRLMSNIFSILYLAVAGFSNIRILKFISVCARVHAGTCLHIHTCVCAHLCIHACHAICVLRRQCSGVGSLLLTWIWSGSQIFSLADGKCPPQPSHLTSQWPPSAV